MKKNYFHASFVNEMEIIEKKIEVNWYEIK